MKKEAHSNNKEKLQDIIAQKEKTPTASLKTANQEDTKLSKVMQQKLNLGTTQFQQIPVIKKIPQIDGQKASYNVNRIPVQPNYRPIMIDYGTISRNHAIPAVIQPQRAMYCPTGYAPNIINPYTNPQAIRFPSDIYYYYPK